MATCELRCYLTLTVHSPQSSLPSYFQRKYHPSPAFTAGFLWTLAAVKVITFRKETALGAGDWDSLVSDWENWSVPKLIKSTKTWRDERGGVRSERRWTVTLWWCLSLPCPPDQQLTAANMNRSSLRMKQVGEHLSTNSMAKCMNCCEPRVMWTTQHSLNKQ